MQTKLSVLWTTIKTQISDIWAKSKMWIIAGASLIIYLKWRQIKEALIVNTGNKAIQSSNKQDQALATQENIDKSGADALVAAAAALPAEAPPVSADWYKTEGDK